MKIYAVRDRMINYYMQPFCAPDDNQVLAALAQQINNEEDKSAITQAPHHFEIWKLGEVKEDGTVTGEKEFLADCSSLIRPNIRKGGDPGSAAAAATINAIRDAFKEPAGAAGTALSAPQKPAQGKTHRGGKKPKGHTRSPRRSPKD